jgi:hypothetical protein
MLLETVPNGAVSGNEDFPGPNKLPTRSVFDLKLALSFNCQTRVCCCFITTNCSVTSLLFCYGYIGHLGALACSFCHQDVSTCIP